MPEISRFYGIIIYMYSFDHNPPHIHVRYGEKESIFYINKLTFESSMPEKIEKRVVMWVTLHLKEILHNWELGQEGKMLVKIKP